MNADNHQNANPYATPGASLGDGAAEFGLADRGTRFGAAIIDALIMMAIILPLMFVFGYFDGIMSGEQPGFLSQMIWAVAGFAIFLLVQGRFLAASGQTLGKKLLKIRIVTLAGDKPEFVKLVALRYLVPQLIYLIPLLGPIFSLVNVLVIFGAERRCVHDYLAGTRVVTCH